MVPARGLFVEVRGLLMLTLAMLALGAGCGDDGGGSGSTSDTTGESATSGAVDPTTAGGLDDSSSTATGDATTSSPTGESVTATSTGDDPTSAAETAESSSGTTGEAIYHLAGTLSYEFVPFDPQAEKLDYMAIETRPIRGVSVRLLDAATDEELAATVSDAAGAYAFDYAGVGEVKLWIFAETAEPVMRVEDNTDQDAIYLLESETVVSAADASLDVVARTGWTGAGYDDPRFAAPFAVLDAAYDAAQRFLAETAPPPAFVPLVINWSVENRPESGDKADGQIGTSHWDSSELYILGKADIDTDEFDSHVIVHEWCHAFEATIARTDTIGGAHGLGDIVDPRVAWSEGACNAMSAIILDPQHLYTDTSGPLQGDSFVFDLELNDIDPAKNPGWYGEATVMTIVYDIYDGANEPFDQVDGGLQAIYDAYLGQRTSPALTTLFSFVAPLKAGLPLMAAEIDALAAYHSADSDFGVTAIADEWATGELHDGGTASNLPLYREGAVGTMLAVDLVGGGSSNRLTQNRYIRIVGTGQPIFVESTCPEDIDLKVYKSGEVVATAASGSGDELLDFDSSAGEIYVLTIQGFSDVPGDYSATITIDN